MTYHKSFIGFLQSLISDKEAEIKARGEEVAVAIKKRKTTKSKKVTVNDDTEKE